MTPITLLPDVLAYPIHEDAREVIIKRNAIWYTYRPEFTFRRKIFDLPPGSYEIIGTVKDCSEEQAEKICPGTWSKYFENRDRPIYKDFADNIYRLDTALESLSSLLKSKGLKGANYLLIRKLK